MQSETIRGHQRSSEVIRGHQRRLRRIHQHSEAISRIQPHTHLHRREHRHSEAIKRLSRGNQEANDTHLLRREHRHSDRSWLLRRNNQPPRPQVLIDNLILEHASQLVAEKGDARYLCECGRRGEHLHAGSLCGSSRKQGTRAFPLRPGHQWSSVVISGHQWSSVVISGHQWSSVVISGHQWSSVVIRLRALPLRPLCARRAPPRAAWVARTR